MSDDKALVMGLFQECSSDAQQIALEVIRLEKQKLHMRNPIGIKEDILGVIRHIIK